MAKDTLWDRDDHTLGKHQVLKAYLEGWFPILGRYNDRIVFIDGFSGPGEYAGGEPGSPKIALDCVKQHKDNGTLLGEVVCIFIEERKDRVEHLKQLVGNQPEVPGVSRQVLHGTFSDHMEEILNYIDEQNTRMAPAFVMIDPFGVKGSEMELVERILSNAKSEVFISFMYEPIRRFRAHDTFEPHLNSLFGSEEWKQCLVMQENDQKKRFLHDLFTTQLKNHGAKYVVNFELWKGNIHEYSIYFATRHEKGCNLMKSAIWKAVPDGSFGFRGHDENQMVLIEDEIDTEPLADHLKNRFGNQPTPIETIDRFIMSDETIYHHGQLRQKTLLRLEKEKRIHVVRPQGGKRGYPPNRGVTVAFL